jgi:hypothetical protein
MRAWLLLLGGMLVWTVHFFALYALGSIFETTFTARTGTVALTLACLAADGWLLVLCLRTARHYDADTVIGWPARLGAPVAVLSLVAVAWQGLPAFLA